GPRVAVEVHHVPAGADGPDVARAAPPRALELVERRPERRRPRAAVPAKDDSTRGGSRGAGDPERPRGVTPYVVERAERAHRAARLGRPRAAVEVEQRSAVPD